MEKLYHYVGPEQIRQRVAIVQTGTPINSADDLRGWLRLTGQQPDRHGLVAVTFVVEETTGLRVADRRSEHVACAGGYPVLSAGELFFRITETNLAVAEASNQSTGYCPEPESWPAVAAALDRVGIPHPGRFTQAVIFRRCPACGQRNLVKDGAFVCGVCGTELPAGWNF
jgi:hypothetical protein